MSIRTPSNICQLYRDDKRPGCFCNERLVFVCGQGPAVIEFANVDLRAPSPSILRPERVLHERRGWVVREPLALQGSQNTVCGAADEQSASPVVAESMAVVLPHS